MVPWYLPLVLAALAGCALTSGLVLALTGRFGERLGTAPAVADSRPRATGAFRIVALGDSLTHGTGDPGGGYAARLAEELRAGNRVVLLTNLAEPGDETNDLLRRMATPEARRSLAEADLILVSAGGNDLNRSFRPRGTGEAVEPEEALKRAGANLRRVVVQLRELNATAPIRLLGLYNPFEILPEDEPAARATLLGWNNAIEQATFPHRGVLTVPVSDLFDGRPDRLARDRFHPGPQGHDLITERVRSTLPASMLPAGAPPAQR